MEKSVENMVKSEENYKNFHIKKGKVLFLGENKRNLEKQSIYEKLRTNGEFLKMSRVDSENILAINLNGKPLVDKFFNEWLDNCFKGSNKFISKNFERLPGWSSIYESFKDRLGEIGFLDKLINFSLMEIKRENMNFISNFKRPIIKELSGEHLLLVSAEYGCSEDLSKPDVITQLFNFNITTMSGDNYARSGTSSYMEIPPKCFKDIEIRGKVVRF